MFVTGAKDRDTGKKMDHRPQINRCPAWGTIYIWRFRALYVIPKGTQDSVYKGQQVQAEKLYVMVTVSVTDHSAEIITIFCFSCNDWRIRGMTGKQV